MMFFNEKYRFKTGLIISAFAALFSFIPRMANEIDPPLFLILLNVFIIFLYSLCCWVFNQYVVQQKIVGSVWLSEIAKVLLSLAFCLCLAFINAVLFRDLFTEYHFFSFRRYKGPFEGVGMVLFRSVFVNGFLYFVGYVLHINAKTQQAMLENERLKQENLEARLYSLKQQLSPHFLFNSLGILNTLTDDVKVHEYTQQLSQIYRYLLNSNNSHLAGVKAELNFINSYLYVLKERFETALQVHINVGGIALTKKLPPASLQLLIENAIKHNILSADEPLRLDIFTEGDYIVVSNNINLKASASESNGTGLHNISERYRLLSAHNIIISTQNNNFTVKLPLL